MAYGIRRSTDAFKNVEMCHKPLTFSKSWKNMFFFFLNNMQQTIKIYLIIIIIFKKNLILTLQTSYESLLF